MMAIEGIGIFSCSFKKLIPRTVSIPASSSGTLDIGIDGLIRPILVVVTFFNGREPSLAI